MHGNFDILIGGAEAFGVVVGGIALIVFILAVATRSGS